jgi:hypothetical protein
VSGPGIDSMRAAGMKVTVGNYPDGGPGVRMSLSVMASKMREGRLDGRVRAWGFAALQAAGIDGRGHEPIRAQAQVLLDAFRAQTSYGADPVASEYIPSAAATMCLDPNLCTRGDDCDGLTVALGSVFLSLGIPARILKQNFGPMEQEHVLLEVQDERGAFFPVDPSTRLAAGSSVRAVSEERIDPLSAPSASTGQTGAEIVTLGRVPLFGVAGIPHALGEVVWDGGNYWVEQPAGRWQVYHDEQWSDASPHHPLGASPPATTWQKLQTFAVVPQHLYKASFLVSALENSAASNPSITRYIQARALGPDAAKQALTSMLSDSWALQSLTQTKAVTGGVDSWELVGVSLKSGLLLDDAFVSWTSLATDAQTIAPTPATPVNPTPPKNPTAAPDRTLGAVGLGVVLAGAIATGLVAGVVYAKWMSPRARRRRRTRRAFHKAVFTPARRR